MAKQNLDTVLKSKAWQEAFEAVRGGFDIEDIKEAIAADVSVASFDGDGEADLLGLFRLKDGRYAVLCCSHDLTNGYQSTLHFYSSLEEAGRMGLSPEQHSRLYPTKPLFLSRDELQVLHQAIGFRVEELEERIPVSPLLRPAHASAQRALQKAYELLKGWED